MRFSEDRLESLVCTDGSERRIHVWEPERPQAVFLALHGGMAHAGDYVTPALYFRRRGIATVSYDMRGHGAGGRVHIPRFECLLDDAEDFLGWVKRSYPGLPIFVLAHSMGALIATHLGLGRYAAEPAIKGYVFSSPYYVNAIKVPRLLVALSKLLARITPTAKVPMASLTDVLTHDDAITQRHFSDERDNIRALEVSCRFASELLRAQTQLEGRLRSWPHPLYAVVAGDDRLADAGAVSAMLQTVRPELLDYHYWPDNYHENFNELNREQIFADIERWLKAQLVAPERPRAAQAV